MTTFSRIALALLVVLFGASRNALADTIPATAVAVGVFAFDLDFCDPEFDENCESFGHFSLSNDVDAADPLYSGLSFGGVVDLEGTSVNFFDDVLTAGESTITLPAAYFSSAAVATLVITSGNYLDYGTLLISGPISLDNPLATVYLDPVSTPEPASIVLLASGLAMAALRRRRIRFHKSPDPCPDLEKAQPAPR